MARTMAGNIGLDIPTKVQQIKRGRSKTALFGA